MANLHGQITYAINQNFKENLDKHSIKTREGHGMGEKVYSYNEKYRLKDISKALTNFFKEQNINIREIKDIKPEHIQSFLNSRKENGCTQNTLNSYASSIYKIQNIVNKTYKSCNVDWRNNVAIPTANQKQAVNRGAESVISRKDYNRLLEYSERNKSQSGYAIQLQDFLGVRVNEVANIKLNNIDLQQRTINIVGKGGKEITREIPQNKVGLVQEVINQHYSKDKLFSIKNDSINRYLYRVQDKLGMEKHSNHDIRRLIAQEHYDSFRQQGYSIKDSVKMTSEWLAHGPNREDLLVQSYIVLR